MAAQNDGMLDSDAFLDAARRGDAHAWESLVQEYRPYLFAVVARTTGNCQAVENSSIVQDALVRAFERIEQFRGHTRAELLGWLARIASNKAHDQRLVRKHTCMPMGTNGEELLAASNSTPSAAENRRERAARVVEAMEKLQPEYREVVHQRIFLSLGYDEIAANLGRTNEAVRWLWVRAVRRLRKELGEN